MTSNDAGELRAGADRNENSRSRRSVADGPVRHAGEERACGGRIDMERRFLGVLVALVAGEVVSYGDIAEVAGYPRRSRAVGRLLATTDVDVAWWRVVRGDGTIATDRAVGQAELLRSEGVIVVGGRVVKSPVGRFSGAKRVRSDAKRE